jgi:hypothetical protein
MGTTGGNREKLLADVQAAGIHAVIAPQMGKQARTVTHTCACTAVMAKTKCCCWKAGSCTTLQGIAYSCVRTVPTDDGPLLWLA